MYSIYIHNCTSDNSNYIEYLQHRPFNLWPCVVFTCTRNISITGFKGLPIYKLSNFLIPQFRTHTDRTGVGLSLTHRQGYQLRKAVNQVWCLHTIRQGVILRQYSCVAYTNYTLFWNSANRNYRQSISNV